MNSSCPASKKGAVVFIDQSAPGLAEQTYMDTLFRVADAFYLLSCSGPEGMHTLFRLDEKMQIAYRFHKRRHSSLIANPTYAVSKNEIYVLGAFDDRLKMLEPFIYVYSLQGKLLRKIRTKYRDIFDINFDASKRLIKERDYLKKLRDVLPVSADIDSVYKKMLLHIST